MKQARLFKPVVLLILILSMALPAIAASAEDVALTVEATQGAAGGTITVKVNATRGTNSWAGLAFTFTYDSTKFTYQSHTVGTGFGLSAVNPNTAGEVLAVFANATNVEKDGTLLTMVFRVGEGVEVGDYTAGLSSRQPDSLYISGAEFINADVATTPGTMVVGDYILGDVDGDGRIFASDAMLMLQYSVGIPLQYTDAYMLSRGDINNDGKVLANDAMLVLQKSVGLNSY